MRRVEIGYRPIPLILATFCFGLCFVWLALGPETYGAIGRALSNQNKLSLLGMIAIFVALLFTAIFGFYVFRMILGYPAIVSDGATLSVNIIPFRKYSGSSIFLIEIEENSLHIKMYDGRNRIVNARLLRDFNSENRDLVELVNQYRK